MKKPKAPQTVSDLIKLSGEYGDAAAANILDMIDLGELPIEQATAAKINELYFGHEAKYRYIR